MSYQSEPEEFTEALKFMWSIKPTTVNPLYLLEYLKIFAEGETKTQNGESQQKIQNDILVQVNQLNNKYKKNLYSRFYSMQNGLVAAAFNIIYAHTIDYPHKGFGFHFFNIWGICSCGLYPKICTILLIVFHIKKLTKKKDKKKKLKLKKNKKMYR